jgi:hypothetical protein
MRNLINTISPPAPRCCRKHCGHWAKFVPVIRIPAKGCPIPEHEPIAIVVEVPLCDAHSSTVKAGEFLTPPLRRMVKAQCRQLGKAFPDFSRAFVQRKPLGQDIQ